MRRRNRIVSKQKKNRITPCKMKYALIALDLDGTLTDDHKDITPRTYDALIKVQQKGIRLCLASGRPPYGMRPLAKQLRLAEYGGMILCYNGGYIEDCATGEVYVEHVLDNTLLPQLYSYQQPSGLTLMSYHDEYIYTEHPDDIYVAQSSRNNKMSIKGVTNFLQEVPRPLHKCMLVGSPELVKEWEPRIAADMNEVMYVCHSTPYFIELLPLGIDKGPALISLTQRLGLRPEQIISFGDSRNDLSMIQMAGMGVAMGNAEDEIKQAANRVTLSNNDDGIAHVIEDLFSDWF